MSNHHSSFIRPVNIETDLAPLADLIEMVFHERMDENGKAAIREMRYMSKLGAGLRFLGQLNDLIVGISQGFVWIEDDRLVGNVSIYPARLSNGAQNVWMIANVGTHPDYRKRGIARLLMERSLAFLRYEKQAEQVLLQVDYDNHHAIHLYETLHFQRLRAFTKWTRSSFVAMPPFKRELDGFFITKPRRHEWEAELVLAQETRANDKGGIGWLKPLTEKSFRPTFWKDIKKVFSLSSMQKLIVRDDNTGDGSLLASLWIERGAVLRRTQLTLMRHPVGGIHAAEALLVNALRLYNNGGFLLEHPYDDEAVSALLTDYRFRPQRTVWHMRYEM
ncbi:MAG: GNAT family N-acetyltransferase [Chloroflexota bacterium]